MNFKRIYAIFLRQMFLLRHSWTRFSNIFVWIILDVVMWGFITKYLNIIGNAEFNFVSVFLGALILWNFLIRVQQGIMLGFFEDVWSRNFINFFASPLTIGEYVLGLIVTCIVTSLLGLFAMLILASAAFGFILFQFGILLVPFIAILFIFGLALGVFTAAFVLRLGPAAEWIAWPLPFFLQPFAGVFYPIAVLPGALQIISKFVPPSYVFEGMRSFLFSGTVSVSSLWIGIGLSIFYLILAYVFFIGIYRSAVRKGRIVRFSAEE